MNEGSRPGIEVFTQTHCASCRAVARFLRDRGVAFTVRDVAADPSALEEITARGHMATPVTRIGGHWIAGFKRKEFENVLQTMTGYDKR